MNDAHHHRAVTEGGVLGGVQDGGSGLVKNGRGGLIHVGDIRCAARGRRAGVIGHLRAARLVACKVVSRQKHRLQGWVIGIHSGVNVGDDSRARHFESGLGLGDVHNDRCGLIDVAIPNSRTGIVHWSGVGQTGGRRS